MFDSLLSAGCCMSNLFSIYDAKNSADFISVGKGGVILHNQVQREDNWVYSKDADENTLKYSKGADENAPFRYFNGAYGNPPFKYSKDASENVTRTIFFLEKDLRLGTTMNYLLAGNSSSTIPFLSRKIVELIPFSSSKLPEILNKFSVKSESEAAYMINNTIQDCELQGARNEAKQCAKKNALAIATEVDKKGAGLIQKYTITTPGVKELAGNKFMVCHKMSYPYAVFYCHAIEKARTYMVPLQGTDGTRAKAVATCHEDTSEWNPNHYAFKELKVEPGTVPICLKSRMSFGFQTKNPLELNSSIGSCT